MAEMTYIQAISDALRLEMRRDVVVELAAFLGQLHGLAGSREQLAARELLEVADSA